MGRLLFKNAKVLLLWGIIFAVVSGGISFLFPRYYGAESTVLIISRDRTVGDPYVQSKSAELVGETLTRIMQTEDFYNKVIEQNSVSFDKSVWQGLSSRQLSRRWAKNVQGQVLYGTSLLTVRAHSKSAEDAVNLATAVTQVAITRGFEYVGSDVTFKVVNNPVINPWATRPNVPLNILVGFVTGLVLAGVWVVRYKRSHLLTSV